jgi:predicted transposase YdaD
MAEHTHHDRFFKRLFGNLAVAADFINNYLPAEITARLDLESLTIEKESFVDEELRNHFSDLLYRVKLKTGGEVFIFLLLEHKSAPDVWVAFQLLRYIVQFWELSKSQGCEKLPLIVPIVLYHGPKHWNVPRRLNALVDSAGMEDLLEFTPDLEYYLRDVSLNGPEEIKGGPRLRSGLSLMRYFFSDDLRHRLPEIFRNLREMAKSDALEYSRSLVAYLSSAGKRIHKEDVKNAMQEVFTVDEFDKSASFIQEWVEEGREEGREEGLQEGLSSLALLQLRHQFGWIDDEAQARICALSIPRLRELGEALLDFTSPADLHQWLEANAEPRQVVN